jgi:hypothetical protein
MKLRQHSVLRTYGLLAALTTLSTSGCRPQSSEQSVDQALKGAGQSRTAIAPLAGKITIDGQPPQTRPGGPRLIIILTNPAKLDAPIGSLPRAFCDSDGNFAFNTYGTGDGVAPGKYVVTIVELKQERRQGWAGPDGLKNLYNDPEKNANAPEFVIDHQPPGKTNYVFALQIEGREPGARGPHSITSFH